MRTHNISRQVNANDEAEQLLYLHAALACVEAWCSHVNVDEELTAPFMPDILEHIDALLSARCHDDEGQWHEARRHLEGTLAANLGRSISDLRQTAKDEMRDSLRDLERLFAATIGVGGATAILSECYHRFRAIVDKPLPAPTLSDKRASILVERALKAADCIYNSQCLRGGTGSRTDEGSPSKWDRVSLAGDEEPAPILNRALARIISGQERADESLQEMLDLLSKDHDVPKLLTPAQAAKLTGIGASTLRAAFDRREIIGKQVGQHRKLDAESLRTWCRSRQAETNGQTPKVVQHAVIDGNTRPKARIPRRFIPPT